MKVNDAIKLIVAVTLCLSFFVWGTVIVMRQVKDVNPTTDTAVDRYRECMANAGSMSAGPCKELSARGARQ